MILSYLLFTSTGIVLCEKSFKQLEKLKPNMLAALITATLELCKTAMMNLKQLKYLEFANNYSMCFAVDQETGVICVTIQNTSSQCESLYHNICQTILKTFVAQQKSRKSMSMSSSSTGTTSIFSVIQTLDNDNIWICHAIDIILECIYHVAPVDSSAGARPTFSDCIFMGKQIYHHISHSVTGENEEKKLGLQSTFDTLLSSCLDMAVGNENNDSLRITSGSHVIYIQFLLNTHILLVTYPIKPVQTSDTIQKTSMSKTTQLKDGDTLLVHSAALSRAKQVLLELVQLLNHNQQQPITSASTSASGTLKNRISFVSENSLSIPNSPTL